MWTKDKQTRKLSPTFVLKYPKNLHYKFTISPKKKTKKKNNFTTTHSTKLKCITCWLWPDLSYSRTLEFRPKLNHNSNQRQKPHNIYMFIILFYSATLRFHFLVNKAAKTNPSSDSESRKEKKIKNPRVNDAYLYFFPSV